jgi:2-dehydro-3-deoxygluconokinase
MQLDLMTFGESMIRLSPPGRERLEFASSLEVQIGGAESNVAINLARLGKRSGWFSRLPDNPLGRRVVNTLRQMQVETGAVVWDDTARMGTYFIEFGSDPRPTQVLYDRANSAASHLTPADLPAERIQSARWLHLTGITAALSDSCRETVAAAIEIAKSAEVTVSFDVNYRAKLWSAEDAGRTLNNFCADADVVFVAARDAVSLFGATGDFQDIARAMQSRWGGAVIVSQGTDGICACDGGEVVTTEAFRVEIVDRVGAGDAMAAGIICRLLEDAPLADALRFGSALAALKMTIPGDLALVSRAEVESLLDDEGGSLNR